MASEHYNLRASHDRLAFMFQLFGALEAWLDFPGEMDRSTRVKISTEGICELVFPQFYATWGAYVGYGTMVSFIKKLDAILKDTRGTGVVIGRNSGLSYAWSNSMHWVSPEIELAAGNAW